MRSSKKTIPPRGGGGGRGAVPRGRGGLTKEEIHTIPYCTEKETQGVSDHCNFAATPLCNCLAVLIFHQILDLAFRNKPATGYW